MRKKSTTGYSCCTPGLLLGLLKALANRVGFLHSIIDSIAKGTPPPPFIRRGDSHKSGGVEYFFTLC
jgi:hypothetical protein